MLKYIRRNQTINKLVRTPIKCCGTCVANIFEAMSNRWRVSGTVDLRFGDLDFKMFSECDDGLVDCFYYNRSYSEARDLKFFLTLAERSRIIVDLGANTGVYSILAARVNPEASIYAFEPYRANMARLIKNCELNGLNNVHFHQKAVGNVNDTIEFTVPGDDRITDVASVNENFSKYFYASVEWKKDKVEQLSIDDFARNELFGNKIDLIKIDVESYEMQVFEGMNSVLTNDQPDILFETFVDDERRYFFNKILADYHYTIYVFLENGLLRLDDGVQKNVDGLNFLLSKHKLKRQYTPYSDAYASLLVRK